MNADEPRALLAERLLRDAGRPSYPLSYPQRRLWFLDQLYQRTPVYTVPLGLWIDGPLDEAALAAALSAVVARHEVLRSVFRATDGVPLQVVTPPAPVPLPVVDLSGAADPEAVAEEHADREARRPFDLSSGPLLRARLLRTGEQRHRLLLTVHHIACDGWSLELLGRELADAYAGRSRPPLSIQYGDYAEWQLTQDPSEHLDFWRERLADLADLAPLPTDRPRPPLPSFRGGAISLPVVPGLAARVAAMARAICATPYAVLLAAFAAVLSRYTGDERVAVGTPVANRDRPEVAQLIGLFTNTVVLRVNAPDRDSFTDLVATVGASVRSALGHQDLPFERLVDDLAPDRDLARNPLFGVFFSYRDDDATAWSLPGCRARPAPGETGTAKFDLTLSLVGGDELTGRLEYGTDLFEPATAQRLAAQYLTLLRAALAEPDRPLAQLPVLPAGERERLLSWGAGQPTVSTVDLPLHRLIEQRAQAAPDEVALIHGEQTLTYGELDRRANGLAHRLRAQGVDAGSGVGVYLDRGVDLVVALLGILKSGAAYVPLDPAYPAARLRFIAADAGLRAVVSGGVRLAEAGRLAPRVLYLPGPARSRPVEPHGGLDDIAYVTYTSGSTGQPKGVQVSHRNLLAFTDGMDRVLGADEPGTWLAVTSVSFDISVLELLWTLARGYRVVLGDPSAATVAPPGSVELSLLYFGSDPDPESSVDPYRLLREGARFADRQGFTAIWTPERHFHRFGGRYPNPAVTGAAVAVLTDRIQIRAGSVVAPLHDPLEIAEQWSVVDNLSGGRVGISFASGWHGGDFVLAPDSYADRKAVMLRAIEEVRTLWHGGTVVRRDGTGEDIEVGIHPRPVQTELPVWVTSARHPDAFRLAGEVGAGLLTHLLGHDIAQLGEKIAIYRNAWRGSGRPHVAVMLHTFIGTDRDTVRQVVRGPVIEYLRTSLDLVADLGQTLDPGTDLRTLPDEELDAWLELAFDRFFETSALLGTAEDAAEVIERLAAIGVDEVACLVDFGVPEDMVVDQFGQLARVPTVLAERRARVAEPLPALLARHDVTHLQCTPSLARALLDDGAALSGLRRLLVGGEVLPADLAADLVAAVGGEVHNMYGPTEATVWATSAAVTGDGVHIGQPLAGARAYVVDRRLRLAPTGVPGELLLGGEYVTRGYRGRPSLTAARYVPDAYSGRDGARLYRTGDLARWRADGRLEFLGRLDDQVKIRGHRIELGEVEAALATHPAVRAAVATVRGAGAARRLVAYYVPAPEMPPADAAALRGFLAETLPDPMVPTAFVPLAELPLTPNRKVDRAALPDPNPSVGSGPTAAPATTMQRLVAEVWQGVLGLEHVPVDQSFFELGGNSLLVVQARTRLRDRTGIELSLVDMFRCPTVAALAAALAGRAAPTDPVSSRPSAPPAGGGPAAGEVAARRRAATAQLARSRGRTR